MSRQQKGQGNLALAGNTHNQRVAVSGHRRLVKSLIVLDALTPRKTLGLAKDVDQHPRVDRRPILAVDVLGPVKSLAQRDCHRAVKGNGHSEVRIAQSQEALPVVSR